MNWMWDGGGRCQRSEGQWCYSLLCSKLEDGFRGEHRVLNLLRDALEVSKSWEHLQASICQGMSGRQLDSSTGADGWPELVRKCESYLLTG